MNQLQKFRFPSLAVIALLSLLVSGCCSDADFQNLPDLAYNELTASSYPDASGNINLNAGDTLEINSEVVNDPADDGDCDPLSAASSLMDAVVTILDATGNPLGTADTLYNVAGLGPEEIDDILSGIIFLVEGDYTLDFGLDYSNSVTERFEDNNLIDVFTTLYQIAMIIFSGKYGENPHITMDQINDSPRPVLPHRIKVHVGSGKPDPVLLEKALETNDFSSFVKFY